MDPIASTVMNLDFYYLDYAENNGIVNGEIFF